jgi:anti-anti-sigma regulatory factor
MSETFHLLNLRTIIQEEFQRDIQDLLTRQTGQKIMDRLEREINSARDNATVVLDFAGVGVIDYSCADEVIAKLVSRLQSNEYGERYLVLKNLTIPQRENIQVALERKNLATLEDDGGNWRVIGLINNYLQKTLEIVMEKKAMSSSELSQILNLELNNVSTRLINLHKIKLVKRVSEVNAQRGKSHFIYQSLFS